jgi:hypothetical protein
MPDRRAMDVTITTPSEFRNQIMEPDYAAFERAPTDLRLAFHTAASLLHLRDWVAHAQSIHPGQLQTDLEKRCKYFGLIRDVANAGKHLVLTQKPSTSMTNAGDVQLRKIGVTGYNFGPGGYGHASAIGLVPVIIVAPEGVLFADAADKVHQMWAQLFKERGW